MSWKSVCATRRAEHTARLRDLAHRAGEQHWGAFRTFRRQHKLQDWDCKLTEDPHWRDQLGKHFSGIFAKTTKGAEDAGWENLTLSLSLSGPTQAVQAYKVEAFRRSGAQRDDEQMAL